MVVAAGGGRGVHGGSGHRLVAEGGTVAAECLVVVHGFLASESSVEAERFGRAIIACFERLCINDEADLYQYRKNDTPDDLCAALERKHKHK